MHQIAVQNTCLSWSLWVASLERVLSKDSVITWAMKEKLGVGVGMGWLNLCSVLLFEFCASHGLSIVGHIQRIDCAGDCGGHRCLSWQQPKNQLVDTSGERSYQAEKGGLAGWSRSSSVARHHVDDILTQFVRACCCTKHCLVGHLH